jgi:hypothetical protein
LGDLIKAVISHRCSKGAIMAEKENKSLGNLNRSGRTPGSKNKTTLFKEAMREGFEKKLLVHGEKVFDAVVERAIGTPMRDTETGKVIKDPETGEIARHPADMTAAKMILDRIVPTQEAKANSVKLGEGGLTIHIERLEAQTVPVDSVKPPIEVTEADYEEIP